MNRIAVIGAGAMGSGIAQVAAMAGAEVILYDSVETAIIKARDSISASLNKFVEKGNLSDAAGRAVFGRLYFANTIDSVADSELILEAILEDETAKKNLFTRIREAISPHTIVATNTSSLSVTALAKHLPYPENFIGIHFFNPPVIMALVEVIPALQTDPKIVTRVMELMKQWGKVPVQTKDTPGFIVNRIARPFYGEALRIAEEQLATPPEIDAAMRTFGQFRMGPFELMDFIGHDINYSVTQSVWKSMYYDTRYKPSLMQSALVNAGWLGKKTGKGFYSYTSDQSKSSLVAEERHRFIFDRILAMLINEAADALYLGIASKEAIDQAMTLGVNYPQGLLQWADSIGIGTCVSRLDELYNQYHEDRYRCSVLLKKMAESNQTFYS